MAEVLVEFDTWIAGRNGTRWVPRACGCIAADGLWEGWIEFTPNNVAVLPVRTPRETEQTSRDGLMYWAQGLTRVYLDGALRRALETVRSPAGSPGRRPHYDEPAARPSVARAATGLRPVLDPFDVYRRGEGLLMRELLALDAPRLRRIAVAYGFLPASGTSGASGKSREELAAAIVAGVRTPSVSGRTGSNDATL